jgi:hypothetical protein
MVALTSAHPNVQTRFGSRDCPKARFVLINFDEGIMFAITKKYLHFAASSLYQFVRIF